MSSLRKSQVWRFGASCLLAFSIASTGCEDGHAATAKSAVQKQSVSRDVVRSTDAQPKRSGDRRLVTFQGACDASGAVELDSRHFAVADDEDNLLRVYDADRGGPPLLKVDLSTSLPLAKGKNAESDLEAATRLGDTAFFLSSHGRTAKGKRDPDRLFLFATTLPKPNSSVVVVGQPYRRLLDDLVEHPGLARFGLREASLRSPKEPGGLNLEGLTAEPSGALLLGFRSPVPEGGALVIRLSNPLEMMRGERAKFSEPIQLDLKGLGVRAISRWGGEFLIMAGPSMDGGPFRLFRFDGQSKVERVAGVEFGDLGPEGFFTPEARSELLVLSDDGSRILHGKACKKLRDSAQKSFRGMWVTLPK